MVQVMVRLDDMQIASGVSQGQADRATEVRYDTRADGKQIELHLTEDNAAAFDKERAAAFEAMKSWHDAGTVVAGGSSRARRPSGPRSGGSASSSADREQNKAMRAALREMGATELSDRGRPPGDLIKAYENGDHDAVKRWNDSAKAARERREAREQG